MGLWKFLRLAFSNDNGVPSSARIIGLFLFSGLLAFLIAATSVLLYRILHTTDAVSLKILVDGFSKFQWHYLYLLAGALALYGINIWKYIAQIRVGSFFNNGDEDDQANQQNQQMLNQRNQSNSYGSTYSQPTLPINSIPIHKGVPVEQHTDTIPPTTKTPITGVGSDD